MSSILNEIKAKYPNTESVQKANNIADGIAGIPVGGDSQAYDLITGILVEDGYV